MGFKFQVWLVQAQSIGSPGGSREDRESRWARFQSNSKLHELDPRPQGRNTTRGQRQRRVSSSGNAESVRQRSGQRARNSSGTHSASGQSSSRMRTQWTARELEQDMPISSSPRFKFHGAGISGAPGQRAPGADTSSYNSERSCATDISHNGGPPEYQLDVVSSVSSAGRENTEGGCGPAGRRAHRYYFVFICQRQRPPKREAPA